MKQYIELMTTVMHEGVKKEDRTGTGTISVFGHQSRYNLEDSFPILTTKKVHFPSVVHELIWFISGDTNVKYLQDNNVRIWNEWADGDGNLGPVYGKQWRDFGGVDQLQELIKGIKEDPNGRRHILSAWNPPEIKDMALPPCHCFVQFYVDERPVLDENGDQMYGPSVMSTDGSGFCTQDIVPMTQKYLSCQLYQRSADVFLGVPFNIACYSLLTHMVAQVCNLEVGDFVHTLGDAHIYNNLIEQCNEQISRTIHENTAYVLLNPKINNIEDFTFEDITLHDYNPQPLIRGVVSV